MSDLWHITNFQIETATHDGIQDALFANGRMQVAVIVKIKAYVSGTGPYELSPAELDTIELIDYDDISAPILPWTCSKDDNGFDHTLPRAVGGTSDLEIEESESGDEAAGPNPNQNFQFRKYWVTTTKLEHKNFGASIKQPIDQCTVHTAGGGFNSHVTITGIAPLDYPIEDMNVEFRDIDNGHANGYMWFQNNLFVKFKSASDTLRKVELSGYCDDPNQPNMKHCFDLFAPSDSSYCRFWFFCPMGPKKTIQVGNKDALFSIEVNQQENAFCMVNLLLYNGPSVWNEVRTWDSKFRVYDRFGNSNEFFIGVGRENKAYVINNR